MQSLVSEAGRFVVEEKSDQFHTLAVSVHKVSDAKMDSGNIIFGRCSGMKNWWLRPGSKKTGRLFMEKESIYPNGSNKNENRDNFDVSCFRSEEQKTFLNGQLSSILKVENIHW